MKYINLSLVVLLVVALSLSVNAADLSDVTNNTAAIFGFEFLTTSGSSSVYSVYSNELTGTTAYWSIESPYLYNELYSINSLSPKKRGCLKLHLRQPCFCAKLWAKEKLFHFAYCAELFSGTEEKCNAPDTGKSDYRIDNSADERIHAAA